ncbi:MAG: hypothetical protein II567_15040 [Candidatus Riflebacteria bacterium]|nr:hypothetical protein [Candidatus Riflebacteria bacterium]
MKTNKKAVSMIEIMIGVLLLALILIPSLNVIIGQAQTVTSTRDHAQAAFLAEKILETARSYPFDMLEEERHANDSDSSKKEKTFEYRLKNKEEYNTHVVNGITYKIDPKGVFIDPITTKNADKDSIPNICAVKFTIQYTGKDGRDHHLDIHTILAQR